MAQIHFTEYSSKRSSQRGRASIKRAAMPTALPAAWEDSFLSYELAEESAGHSTKSIANRRSAVSALARWPAENENITRPAEITSAAMQRYFKYVYATRERSGVRTHYNDLRAYFKHECGESGQPSPLGSIHRPRRRKPSRRPAPRGCPASTSDVR
jgi:hypothetical protein